jgi:putative GTP pyrophosphokinase
LSEKYLDSSKDYRELDDIHDQAGLRIITYYEDDVDRAAAVIKREFHLDPENSIDKRVTEPDRFGYRALNCICKHLEKRVSDVEYKRFAGIWCEIQITSILSHAWSEMEHEWYDLREAYPEEVKRKFSQLAALLQLAESQFVDIRKSRTQYEQSVAVRIGAKVLDLPVNAVSLKSFIEQDPLVAQIDQEISAIVHLPLGVELTDRFAERRALSAILAGMTKLQDVHDSLAKFRSAVISYVRRREQEPEVGRLLPGVSIQHLSNMLVYARGTPDPFEYLRVIDLKKSDIASDIAIAKQAVAGNTT